MRADKFAPVDSFELLQDPIPSGVLRGIATPVSGPKPCALALVAGEATIATSAAMGFSQGAAERGIRQGWCAFQIGGLHQAVALGHDVELRCIVSGQVQIRWEGSALAASLTPPRPKYLAFSDLRTVLRGFDACTDLQQVLPFALELARISGSRTVRRASYQYFLERPPEPAVEAERPPDLVTAQAVLKLWSDLSQSPEHRALDRQFLPGPFDPRFPFSLHALDERGESGIVAPSGTGY
jgi:hypothetical protein